MQATTAAKTCRFTAGLDCKLGQGRIEGVERALLGRNELHRAEQIAGAGLEGPLDILRPALSRIGQRGKDDGCRLRYGTYGLEADDRCWTQSKLHVQIAKEDHAETVLE